MREKIAVLMVAHTRKSDANFADDAVMAQLGGVAELISDFGRLGRLERLVLDAVDGQRTVRQVIQISNSFLPAAPTTRPTGPGCPG